MTIWDIRSRWLRAVAAWLLGACIVAFLAFFIALALVISIVRGIITEPVRTYRQIRGDVWDWEWDHLWLAMTGREP